MHRFAIAALAAALGSLAGCKSLDSAAPASTLRASAADAAPVKMVAVWSDTVLYHAGKPPTRGFGGRVYFYNERHEVVPAEGQLVVYGFDDSQHAKDASSAERKYVITPEQFAAHRSQSELGPSYSVWIPWDEAGQPLREVSLIPVFMPTNGAIVAGEQTRHVLPGKRETAPSPAAAAPAPFGQEWQPGDVRPVAYHEMPEGYANSVPASPPASNAAGSAIDSPRMRTTTIPLPPAIADRLATPPYAGAPHNDGHAAMSGGAYPGSQGSNGSPTLYEGAALLANPRMPAAGSPAPRGPAETPPTATPWSHPGASRVPTVPRYQVAAPQSTRFSPQRFRVPGEPIERLSRENDPWPLAPGAPQYAPPSSR
jgi:hypothetical protein